jgi:hypothetical protein
MKMTKKKSLKERILKEMMVPQLKFPRDFEPWGGKPLGVQEIQETLDNGAFLCGNTIVIDLGEDWGWGIATLDWIQKKVSD